MPKGVYKRKFGDIPATRTCGMCKKTKDIKFFQIIYFKAKDYHWPHSYCIPCFTEYLKENHIKNREKHRLYVRNRYKQNPTRDITLTSKWTKKNPEKVKAQVMVRKAIKDGSMKRLPCEICGKIKTHAHHPNYKKPLLVRWLCSVHHKAEHLKLK